MTLTGCLSSDDDGEGEHDDRGLTASEVVPDFPDPAVVDLRHPEPQGVSTDDQQTAGDSHEFSVTVENTGTAGDIEMTLVLLESQEQSVWSLFADEAGTYQRFFSDGDRRTETFTAELGSQHEAFGFRLLPAEAEVDVRNDGGAGAVDVRLVQRGGVSDGVIIEDKTVDIPADTTQTVQFSVDAEFALETDIDDIQLDAETSVAFNN
jgi:hypothetical protein